VVAPTHVKCAIASSRLVGMRETISSGVPARSILAGAPYG